MSGGQSRFSDLEHVSNFFTYEVPDGVLRDLIVRWKGGGSLLLASSNLKPDAVARTIQDKLIEIEIKGIPDEVVGAMLVGIDVARLATPKPTLLMTIPNQAGKTSKQTRSFAEVVSGAERSVICMTYNFQKTTQYFDELKRLALKESFELEIYVDGKLALQKDSTQNGPGSMTLEEIRWNFPKAHIFASKKDDEKWITSHAKVFVIDGVRTFITSANFSKSAENSNVEIGVLLEDPATAKQITDQLALINQGAVYEEYL